MYSTQQNLYYERSFPWSESDTDRRFSRISRWLLLLFILLGIVIGLLPEVEKPDKKTLSQVNPRLAKLIMQKQQQPSPPVVKKPVLQNKKSPQVQKKQPASKSRKNAEKAGLMTMRNELASLQNMFDTQSLQTSQPVYQAQSQKSRTGSSKLVSKRADQGSGGVDTASLSREVEATSLQGRQRSSVKSNLPSSASSSKAKGGHSQRSLEEIQLVFLKNKGAINTIYNRALRRDPMLQGKVVVELSISANGRVLSCKIVSSQLGNPSLERKLVARIKSFQFPARNVGTVTVRYPLDFLPS